MYEGDAPLAERRAQALTLDRRMLAELVGSEELRELHRRRRPSPSSRPSCRRSTNAVAAKTVDAAHDLLRRLGDLTAAELRGAASAGTSARPSCVADRRAVVVRVAGEERLIAAEDAGRYRDGLGVPPPPGLPEAFLAPGRRRPAPAGAPLGAGPTGRSWPGSRRPASACGDRARSRRCWPRWSRDGPARAGRVPARRVERRVVRRRGAAACCGSGRWPRCATRWSRPRPRRWPVSSPPGRGGSAGTGVGPDRGRRAGPAVRGDRPAAGGPHPRQRARARRAARAGCAATRPGCSTSCWPPAR